MQDLISRDDRQHLVAGRPRSLPYCDWLPDKDSGIMFHVLRLA
jgi:hypothetical protein